MKVSRRGEGEKDASITGGSMPRHLLRRQGRLLLRPRKGLIVCSVLGIKSEDGKGKTTTKRIGTRGVADWGLRLYEQSDHGM